MSFQTSVLSLLPQIMAVMVITFLPPWGVAQTTTCFASKVTTFLDNEVRAFEADLRRCRPVVNPEFRGANLAGFLGALPEGGEITKLTDVETRKLVSLDRILTVHDRQSVYVTKVLALPQAAVGLYGRTVLWISQSALKLLDEEELQAVVAHEIGHDYLWDATRSAQQGKDQPRLRQIELFCDAVAIHTLRQVGVQPSRLISAIEKLERFNRSASVLRSIPPAIRRFPGEENPPREW